MDKAAMESENLNTHLYVIPSFAERIPVGIKIFL